MVTPERGWAQRETDGWVASGSPLPEAAWNNLKTGDAAEMQAERRKRNLMPRGPDFLCWEMRLLTAGGWLGSELQAPGPWAPCLKTCAQIYSPAARLLCARGVRLCSPLTFLPFSPTGKGGTLIPLLFCQLLAANKSV